MIVEQQIESRLVSTFAAMFAEANLNIQVAGLLNNTDVLKGAERSDADGVMIIKARPRSYSTPTNPECQIEIDVAVTIRADKDCNGKSFADVFELLIDQFQEWQRCLDDAHEMFTIENAFSCTGYVLNDGDTATDASGKNWTYTHSMTVHGVIEYTDTDD